MTPLRPGLHILPAHGPTRAVVLTLHGGKEASYEQSEPLHLSSRRMRPFARAIHRQGAPHGVAVWSVRYRVRGWNAPELSPVQDARWALEEVRATHGDVPVVLVGHSMGGRAAVHVLDDPSVVAMVALAPWLPGDPARGASERRVLLAHGLLDRWTSTDESQAWAELARPLATALTYVEIRRSGHFLAWRARLWTDLTVGFALTSLGHEPAVGRMASHVLAQAAAGEPTLRV